MQLIAEKIVEITSEIQLLIDVRLQIRVDKYWKLADEIRDQLKLLGFKVRFYLLLS